MTIDTDPEARALVADHEAYAHELHALTITTDSGAT